MATSLAKPAEPLLAAFRQRAARAIDLLAHNASPATLQNAMAAPTDVGAIAQVLASPDAMIPAVAALDESVHRIALNAANHVALLEEAGGTFSAGEVGKVLGISRQAVDKRRRQNRLLAINVRSDWRYPRCQFDAAEGTIVSGVDDIVRTLAPRSPWSILDFLVTPDEVLDGRSPLEALRQGEPCRGMVPRLVRVQLGDGFA